MERLRDYLPLENHEAELRPGSRGLYIVSRHRMRGTWTWIGLYKPFATHLTGRPGAFFGIGIWLRDVTLPGDEICTVLESASAKVEAMMARAKIWDATQFDFRDVGCDEFSARSLLSHYRKIEGGLGYGTGGAKVAIKVDARMEPQGVGAAVDHAQGGRNLHAYSRALIPMDEEASFDVGIVQDWVVVGGETGLMTKLHSYLGARTPALPAPAPRPPDRDLAATHPGMAEAEMERRLMFVEAQIREVEQKVAFVGKPPYSAYVMSAAALLCVVGYVAGVSLAPLLPVAVRQFEPADNARQSAEAVLPPVSQSIVESQLPRPTASTSESRDAAARIEGGVKALWALVEGSSSLTIGERRALNRSLGELIDTLRFSSDPKLKSAGEQLVNVQAEQSRSKLRNSN